jgi:hypothetical protein
MVNLREIAEFESTLFLPWIKTLSSIKLDDKWLRKIKYILSLRSLLAFPKGGTKQQQGFQRFGIYN